MNKQHILDEIKRTAKANGGTPLGINRFQEATGIRREDCVGKYWARWSDAIREAGFVPNTLQAAYTETEIMEKFIELTRELGHLPVKAEMQMKARRDGSFPHYATFNKRFGSRTSRIEAVSEYCRVRPGYEDIVNLCEAALSETWSAPADDEIDTGILGYIYLMKSGKYYKIGRSVSTGQRERQLSIQLPEKLSTIHTIATDDPIGIEAYWHKRFEPKRKNGEWFDLDKADISAFRRRKFM